jgi:hypothetical protein
MPWPPTVAALRTDRQPLRGGQSRPALAELRSRLLRVAPAAPRASASEAYQRILPLRTHHTISDLIFIDALPEGFTVKGFAEQVRAAIAG